MVCQMPYTMMFQIGKDSVGVTLETKAGDFILVLEQEGLFVLNMESKNTHLLHLLYYCCVETFVQIQDPAISNILVVFVRKQLELTKMESCATCVRDGFIQEDNV